MKSQHSSGSSVNTIYNRDRNRRYAADDSMVTDHMQVHALMKDLDNDQSLSVMYSENRDLHTHTRHKANLQNRFKKPAQDSGDDHNTTDMFFKFDSEERPYSGNHSHSAVPVGATYTNGNAGVGIANMNMNYPPQMYPYYPANAPMAGSHPMYMYPQPHSQHVEQHPPRTQHQWAPAPTQKSVLKDSTNIPSQSRQPSAVNQMYSQYNTADIYGKHMLQTHNQIQLSQALHQRQVNNNVCNDHTK